MAACGAELLIVARLFDGTGLVAVVGTAYRLRPKRGSLIGRGVYIASTKGSWLLRTPQPSGFADRTLNASNHSLGTTRPL